MAKVSERVFIPRTEEEFKKMIEALFTEHEVIVDIETYIALVPQLVANEIVHTVTPIAHGVMIIISVEAGDYNVKVIKEEEMPESLLKAMSELFG